MTTKDIEAGEKAATPLTDEEYAEWKGNIEAIAEAHAGNWYKRETNTFVLASDRVGGEITTTIKIQLRLFATIDDLLAQLKDREEKLAAVKRWRHYKMPMHSELDRILKGGD